MTGFWFFHKVDYDMTVLKKINAYLGSLNANTKSAKFKFFLMGYIISLFFTMGLLLYQQYTLDGSFNPIGELLKALILPILLSWMMLLYATFMPSYFVYFFAYLLVQYLAFKITQQIPYFKITILAVLLSAINLCSMYWFAKTQPII